MAAMIEREREEGRPAPPSAAPLDAEALVGLVDMPELEEPAEAEAAEAERLVEEAAAEMANRGSDAFEELKRTSLAGGHGATA